MSGICTIHADMSNQAGRMPLSELDWPADVLASLGELADIRTVRDFAVLSRFPEHCLLLADWLSLPVDVILAVAERAASFVPPDQLDRLAERLRPTVRFPLGMQPPQAA